MCNVSWIEKRPEMERTDDKEILLRCQHGDEKAFQALVKRYYQKAYLTALYYTHNSEVALDISQEAFIRVHRNISRFDVGRSFAAWLHTIVKNLCTNYLSRYKRKRILFSDFFSGNRNASGKFLQAQPEERLEQEERHALVWKALQQLPENDREIILLKDFEDFSYLEISEVLDIPVGTVMSRLYYARRKLMKALEKVL